VDVGKLRTRLLAAVGVVAGLGLAAELVHARAHGAVLDAIVAKLSLSYEANLPTWFASSLLLACAVAAAVIAHELPRGAPWRRHWWGIAIALAWVSLDETAELHEHLGGHFAFHGVLYFDWVIWAAAIVAVLAAVYIPFVRALRPATRTRLVIAAVVYVGGALVMELPLGWWTDRAGSDTIGYALIDWVEETMELAGAALALAALIAHRRETEAAA
jgi:hypothetical protein